MLCYVMLRELGKLRGASPMVPSVAWAPRTVSAIVGMKRASADSCHPHADGELMSVAIVRTTTTWAYRQRLSDEP